MKKTFIIFLFSFSVIFGLLNQSVMDAYQLQYPVERAETFELPMREDYRKQIEDAGAEIVVVGDSAIRELNGDYFSQILGKKTLIFSAPATGSAYWYLFLRHQILEAENSPEMVFFFFRGVTLTVPGYLTNGNYRTRLEETATNSDADVYALAITADENPLLHLPERYIPLFAYRSEIYQNKVTQVRNWLPVYCSIATILVWITVSTRSSMNTISTLSCGRSWCATWTARWTSPVIMISPLL